MHDVENLRKIVSESSNITECLTKLGYSAPRSKHVRTSFRKRIEKFDIDISHFLSSEDIRKQNIENIRFELDDILSGLHPTYGTNKLKLRLYNENVKKPICEDCGLSDEWNGKPLVLHLDHIDGNSQNHRLHNLRILCPNCHSQTDTYCGKNKKSLLN